MTNSLYLRAKELQNMAGHFLYEGNDAAFTDIQDWTEMQNRLAQGIEQLVYEKGENPDAEAERILAVLMGYAVAIRNPKHIRQALMEAERVLPKIKDQVLKCHLMVFCYAECFDEELGKEVHRLLDELKGTGFAEEMTLVEEFLKNMEEGLE